MKRLIFILTICLSTIFAHGEEAITRNFAKQRVENFYKAVQQAPTTNVNDIYNLKSEISSLTIPAEMLRHPSDVQFFISQAPGIQDKLIFSYISDINKLNQEHNIKIDYKICDIKDLREVVYRNDRERLEPTYWSVSVDKTITIDGVPQHLTDTVDVKISNGKIAYISNRICRVNSEFRYNDGKKTPGKDSEKEEAFAGNHRELAIRAARLWSQGRKREAYQAYVESVRNVEDPETLFRIGLLLINHRKECTDLKKNEAQDLAYDYFCRARKVGHADAARVINHWWGTPPGHNL